VAKTLLDYEKKQGANESTYWLRFELLWRDFFLRLYQKHPKTFFTPRGFKKVISPGLKHGADWSYPFEQENIEVPILHKSGDKGGYYQAFLGWITGETGEPLIDASMRELFFTGFISNRSRQCAASYLINNLGVPWWWGAAWFEYHLLDYDPFSNWGTGPIWRGWVQTPFLKEFSIFPSSRKSTIPKEITSAGLKKRAGGSFRRTSVLWSMGKFRWERTISSGGSKETSGWRTMPL
jgi:hypothetical protein